MIRRTAIKRGKTSARKLRQSFDLLIRERILERDGRRCVRCGAEGSLAASHVFPKGKYPRMRFLEVNLLSLCYGCHIHWWHKDPIAAGEWFKKTYPERLEVLRVLRDTAPKVDLKALLAELKGEVLG